MPRRSKAVPSELRVVLDRITRWRRTRRKLSPMPEDLWAEAATVARRVGVSAVATAAGLGYAALKRRVATASTPSPDLDIAPGFIEFTGAQLLGASSASGPVVEVSGPDGARLTIRLPAHAVLDVESVVAAFHRGRA